MTADPLVLDAFAGLVDRLGRRWHDYQVCGAEQIPRDRGSLLVFYHGLVPVDGYLLTARLYREHGLFARALADRWLFELPGLSTLVRAGGAVPAAPETARSLLDAGYPVLVSPGGVREAIAGRPGFYRVTWGDRQGFARLALDAHVPILPVFSENIEEAYRAPFAHARLFQALYERTRLPLVPIVGLGLLPFPVKLRTWIGEPIEPRDGETAAALRDRTREALQALIDAHQGPRPRLLRGLVQRVTR